VGKGEEIQMLI